MTKEHHISRAPFKPFEIGRNGYDIPDTLEKLPVDRKPIEDLMKLSWYENLTLKLDEVVNKTVLGIQLLPYVLQIVGGIMFKNWKTTLAGVVGLIGTIANAIINGAVTAADIAAAIASIGLIFAKDSDKTGV